MNSVQKYGGFGFENSGHIIIDPFYPSDSIASMLFILSNISSEVLSDMNTFTPLFMSSINVPNEKVSNSMIISLKNIKFDSCRIIIRNSGTENVLRITTETHEKNLHDQIIHKIKKICKLL